LPDLSEEADILLHIVPEHLVRHGPVQGTRRVAYDESNVDEIDINLDLDGAGSCPGRSPRERAL